MIFTLALLSMLPFARTPNMDEAPAKPIYYMTGHYVIDRVWKSDAQDFAGHVDTLCEGDVDVPVYDSDSNFYFGADFVAKVHCKGLVRSSFESTPAEAEFLLTAQGSLSKEHGKLLASQIAVMEGPEEFKKAVGEPDPDFVNLDDPKASGISLYRALHGDSHFILEGGDYIAFSMKFTEK